MKMRSAALAALFALTAALTACSGGPEPAPSQSLLPQSAAAGPESLASDSEAGADSGSGPASVPSGGNETEIRSTGESISGYKSFAIRYEDGTESAIERGVEGLTYTLEGVKVYDSIGDAGVDMYGCTVDSEDILARPFVLVELKAGYTAPAGGPLEVIADANDLTPLLLMDRLEAGSEPAFPTLGYFSLRPGEGDAKLDSQHQAYCYIIKDGESVTFQLGVFCDRALIDTKNLFLEVNAVPAPPDGGTVTGDTVKRMFDLLGE